jgi:hypothetical protein
MRCDGMTLVSPSWQQYLSVCLESIGYFMSMADVVAGAVKFAVDDWYIMIILIAAIRRWANGCGFESAATASCKSTVCDSAAVTLGLLSEPLLLLILMPMFQNGK